MADVYNFFKNISLLDENRLTPEDATKIEEFLNQEYPEINLSEEDTQKIYANIMRSVIKFKNRQQNKEIGDILDYIFLSLSYNKNMSISTILPLNENTIAIEMNSKRKYKIKITPTNDIF